MLPDPQPFLPGIKASVLAPVPSLPLALGPDCLIDPSCFDLIFLTHSSPVLQQGHKGGGFVIHTSGRTGSKYPFNKQKISKCHTEEYRKPSRISYCNWTPLHSERSNSLGSSILHNGAHVGLTQQSEVPRAALFPASSPVATPPDSLVTTAGVTQRGRTWCKLASSWFGYVSGYTSSAAAWEEGSEQASL